MVARATAERDWTSRGQLTPRRLLRLTAGLLE